MISIRSVCVVTLCLSLLALSVFALKSSNRVLGTAKRININRAEENRAEINEMRKSSFNLHRLDARNPGDPNMPTGVIGDATKRGFVRLLLPFSFVGFGDEHFIALTSSGVHSALK